MNKNKMLKTEIYELIKSKKAMGISFIAQKLGISDKDAICELDTEEGILLHKDNFEKIWEFLTGFGELTFTAYIKNSFIEVKTQANPGKNAFGYFNLNGTGALNGHLKLEDIAEIALLSVPFLHLESHQIAFLDNKGNILYSFFLSRKDHKLKECDVAKFKSLKEQFLCAHL